MYTAQQLVDAGFYGYRGWSDEAAHQNYMATGGEGKGALTNPAALQTTTTQQGQLLPSAYSVVSGQEATAVGPTATFDWEQAERDALEKLRPYYEQKLAEAGGDVELAKSRIQEDYDRGTRYRQEDLSVAQRGFDMTFPRERRNLMEDMNRRGLLASTIRKDEEQFMDESQQRRREAVRRGIMRKQTTAGIERDRAIQDIDIKFPRYKRELEEEKKLKAADMAQQKYGRDQSRFLAETSRYIS